MTVPQTRPPGVDPHQGYWREYRVGPVTEAAYAVGSTLVAAAVGLTAGFAAILLIALLGEQGLVPEASSIDLVARSAMGWLVAFAYLCAVAVPVALSVRAVGVSRSLVRAADDGAEPLAAPHPAQVEQVVLPPHLALLVVLGGHVALGLLAMVAAVVDDEPRILRVCVGVVLVSAALAAWLLLVSRPAHRRRQRRVAEHWSAHAEQSAWGAARKAVRAAGERPRTVLRGTEDPQVRRGWLLVAAGAVVGCLGCTLLELFLFVQYPGSVARPGGRLQDRGDFSDGAQAVLDGALWVAVTLGLAGILLAAAGGLLLFRARATERAELSRALDDVTATRPDDALLQRHGERRPSDLGQVAAALGSFVLVPALAVLQLATGDDADHRELFAGLQDAATAGVVLGAVLLFVGLVANAVAGVRGHALRDRLQRRWPTLPRPPEDRKNPRHAPRTKPTLRRGL
ncbi:hypothetical protein GCM10023340_17050 [Nocardioides marinquilinus]|uniref:Uncharacterized protein n=1 Tax=Nocardioides marinquilinus TaxID=1210400 RepID=A0ABP9PGY6_9ACTN